MNRYLIEREFGVGNVPPKAALEAAIKQVIAVNKEMGNVKWVRSWVSEAEGKIYCEYDAPNPDVIREHGKRTGMPVTKISMVAMQIDPAMFM